MTMHKALQPRNDVDRLYVSRKEGGRGLASTEYSADATVQRLENNIKKHGGRLIIAIRNNTNMRINITKITRKENWEENQLYGYFERQKKTWTWLTKRNH